MSLLKNKKILLCITGSIAAYKSVVLLRLLQNEGAEVKIIMTEAAEDFVTPLTLSTLSKSTVLSALHDNEAWANHVMLGRWADVIVIAPASCNTIAKMANGICDNLLQAVYFSATCVVMVAPAMDEDMWIHAATQKNVTTLKNNNNIILGVNEGELASGLIGMGRMLEPDEILQCLNAFFSNKDELHGVKALVTAGPTYESIDPVRFIGNHSTGIMGIAIAQELSDRGADVKLVIGPSTAALPDAEIIRVTSADEMYRECMSALSSFNLIIMAAAVSDYTPEKVFPEKIKKDDNTLTLKLKKTKDILFEAGQKKLEKQILVGFALETEDEKANALQKLSKKNLNLVVLNSLKDEGAGFGNSTNKITIFDNKGHEFAFEKKSKKESAKDIVNTIIKYKNA